MQRKCLKVLTLVALLAAAPAWAVNKCNVGGQVVYQQAPCAGNGETVGAELQRRESARQAEENQRAKLAADRREVDTRLTAMREAKRQERLKAAGVSCPAEMLAPAVGMKEVVFLECTELGSRGPNRLNETETAAGVSRQYVFELGRGTERQYIYVRGGVITAIQR